MSQGQVPITTTLNTRLDFVCALRAQQRHVGIVMHAVFVASLAGVGGKTLAGNDFIVETDWTFL